VADPITTSTVATPAAAEPLPAQVESAPIPEPAAQPVSSEQPAIQPGELRLPRPAPPRSRAAEAVNGQVAVFISRREKRIFVRLAFVPLFDMPVEIANPNQPLGTHTYTALETTEGGTHMRWNVISMPVNASAAVRGRGAPTPPTKSSRNRQAPIPSVGQPSDATEALDRITIPQEAIERISDLLTPGSSLVISDEGLGRETGRYTEFIVETHQ
jgi:hypothetical protein